MVASRLRVVACAVAVVGALVLAGCGSSSSSAGSGGASSPASSSDCVTQSGCAVAGGGTGAAQPPACTSKGTGRSDDFKEPVTVTTRPDGLGIGDVVTGSGAPLASGQTITGVQYTLWLSDGTKIQSSRDPGSGALQPFAIGQGAVIKGWDLGLVGMHVGGVRRLVVPPALGYGASSPPGSGIPPNATLVFDIEVICAA